jgi:hypothetical protein
MDSLWESFLRQCQPYLQGCPFVSNLNVALANSLAVVRCALGVAGPGEEIQAMFDSKFARRLAAPAVPMSRPAMPGRDLGIERVSQLETFRDLSVAVAACLCVAVLGSLLAAAF